MGSRLFTQKMYWAHNTLIHMQLWSYYTVIKILFLHFLYCIYNYTIKFTSSFTPCAGSYFKTVKDLKLLVFTSIQYNVHNGSNDINKITSSSLQWMRSYFKIVNKFNCHILYSINLTFREDLFLICMLSPEYDNTVLTGCMKLIMSLME